MDDIKYYLSPKGEEDKESKLVYSSVYRQWSSSVSVWHPPTDLFETENALIVRIEIAGMKDSDFSITLEDRTLSIHGSREGRSEPQAYFQMEIHSGEFLSLLELPSPVNYDEIAAEYVDGFLQVVLPKEKPKKIEVRD